MKLPNLLLSIVALLATATSSQAATTEEDPYESSGWKKLNEFEDPDPIILVRGTKSEKPIPLLTISTPNVTSAKHLLVGEVSYSDVAGTAFLEMWTHYSLTEYYFSRTLGEHGPMAKITGASEWRSFILPFNGKEDTFPTKLQFNLILPESGSVQLRNLTLYQRPGERVGAWWKPGIEGIIGGGSGAFFGILCGICTTIASRGKARSFVLIAMMTGLILAIAILLTGLAAAAASQPGYLVFPLLLSGSVATFVTGFLLFQIKKAYLKHELQRIAAAG